MDALVSAVVPLAAGYLLDLLLGDPAWLPHPIVGFGRAIAAGERTLNRGGSAWRFTAGAVLAAGLIVATYAAARALEAAAARWHPAAGLAVATVGVFYALANRTLIAEGRAVFAALERGVDAGRRQLARIVGRDTARLSPAEIRVAVCETMAENLSDGVVAPLCWYAVGGMPAMLAYKMVNTLDSMIGHHDSRYEWFGKAAARIDDVANFGPARLTALLLVAVARSGRGWHFVRRFGRAHESPNSGYPEAALAGILDVRFGGPHTYDGERIEHPWIGENPRDLGAGEIGCVARLNHAVCLVAVALAGGARAWAG
ncbi:adenosylcobinamide-phosphate synthase CbiB [Opitutus sp. ER46]|uniref:adenosylcobinamide-phosphate synthase CbiB n=1 Tax=Opitutus sp. ER46 TaxID=2161864 RepID=UPI000D31C8F0|nr:adenosylcobinamide-phosphate synthase CbiB [Opitutus sp. ER46]PTX92388.1 cobalamin biosynthesis protein CobD [Opitutus sp. ER46]